MIYSRSSGHAIRAFVHLARLNDGSFAMVKQIAEDESIPAPFLAKILQHLARKGMLKSSKGPAGGFALQRPPGAIRLLDIVEAVDGGPGCECPLGFTACSKEVLCPVHDGWTTVQSRIMEYLEGSTVADLAAALEKKKRGKGQARRKLNRASAVSKRG